MTVSVNLSPLISWYPLIQNVLYNIIEPEVDDENTGTLCFYIQAGYDICFLVFTCVLHCCYWGSSINQFGLHLPSNSFCLSTCHLPWHVTLNDITMRGLTVTDLFEPAGLTQRDCKCLDRITSFAIHRRPITIALDVTCSNFLMSRNLTATITLLGFVAWQECKPVKYHFLPDRYEGVPIVVEMSITITLQVIKIIH